MIEVTKLSKAYRLGQIGRTSLKEEINRWWDKFRQRETSPQNQPALFWALNEVSFSVGEGEVLGIIGRNGAGKSTLLKILSRITEPTGGEAILRGRVSSLLEIGTGFHPDLTGRENIYLNGSMLGMKHREITAKFDEIVAFAGVERFLDTPVKRYSSGMQVRLGFSVAAHLEPDVLIVDEVLAVGDWEFQQKCLGKMDSVARGEGRTVLLVSHNMASIQTLCPRTIVLKDGQIICDAPSAVAIDTYLETKDELHAARNLAESPRHPGLGEQVRITQCRMMDSSGNPSAEMPYGEQLSLEITLEASKRSPATILELAINDRAGTAIAALCSRDAKAFFDLEPNRPQRVLIQPRGLLLHPGHYTVGVCVKSGNAMLDFVSPALGLHIKPIATEGAIPFENRGGALSLAVDWMTDH